MEELRDFVTEFYSEMSSMISEKIKIHALERRKFLEEREQRKKGLSSKCHNVEHFTGSSKIEMFSRRKSSVCPSAEERKTSSPWSPRVEAFVKEISDIETEFSEQGGSSRTATQPGSLSVPSRRNEPISSTDIRMSPSCFRNDVGPNTTATTE